MFFKYSDLVIRTHPTIRICISNMNLRDFRTAKIPETKPFRYQNIKNYNIWTRWSKYVLYLNSADVLKYPNLLPET